MRTIALLLAAMTSLAGDARAGTAEIFAARPELTPSQGRALITLARQTMANYLLTTSGDNRVTPPADLAGLNYQASVTLRRRGAVVAQVIKSDGDSLAENVAQAALKAMRSEKLPNRVGQAVLDSLTVEVEVIGPAIPADESDLAKLIEPGLTGLLLTRGTKKAYALPSTAYEVATGAQQMQLLCLPQIPLDPATMEQKPQWSIFTTRHFVSLPDGLVMELYRGKRIEEFDSLSEQTLTDAARKIGLHLLANQDPSGQYHTESGKPSLRDHFYACLAMSKLAVATGDEKFSASVHMALAGTSRSIISDSQGAFVNGPNPNNQLASSAYLAMSLFMIPKFEDAESIMAGVVKGMKADFLTNGRLTGRLDGHGAGQASAQDQAIAAMAIKLIAPQEKLLAGIAKALNGAQTPEATLWACRVGLRDFPADGIEGFSQTGPNRPADERGGYALNKETPTVKLTALLGLCETAPKNAQLAARRFCYQMIFRPGEAYFEPNPDQWVGAVRTAPTSPEVSLADCARAIEALLSPKLLYQPLTTLPHDQGPETYTTPR